MIGPRGLDSVLGGVERHCALLYPALGRQAPDIALRLFIRGGETPAGMDGLRLETIRTPGRLNFETFIYALRALLRSVRSSDIIHFHGIGPGFLAPVARLFGVQVAMTHHAVDYQRPRWGWLGRSFLKLGERLGGRFSHRVVCVSEALRQDFLGRLPEAAPRTITIHHGAALADPAPDEATLVRGLGLVPGAYLLAVGRLEETKRFADLIAAHRQAGDAVPPLVIVGMSLGNPHHERRLRALAAGTRVIFLGSRRGVELAALYRHAAAFLHASAMEGFGLVILEALLAGTRTIVSDIPVHREFGLPPDAYFAVGDVAAIAGLMRGVGPRTADWAAAAPIAARYSLAAEIDAHLRLYRDLAASIGVASTASNAAQ